MGVSNIEWRGWPHPVELKFDAHDELVSMTVEVTDEHFR